MDCLRQVSVAATGCLDKLDRWCDRFPCVFGGPLTHIGVPLLEATDTSKNSAADATTSETSTPPPSPRLDPQPDDDISSTGDKSSSAPNLRDHDPTDGGEKLPVSKITSIMAGEFIGLATHSMPHAFETLGLGTAAMVILAVALIYWYTSMAGWQLCLRHPASRNVTDLAAVLLRRFPRLGACFGFLSFMALVLMIMAAHIKAGGEIAQVYIREYPSMQSTMEALDTGPISFGCVVCLVLCFVLALPRKLGFLEIFTKCSVITTAASTLLALVVFVTRGPKSDLGTSWWWNPASSHVERAVAVLHVTFAFLGQPSIPVLVANMREPRDFPKALALSLTMQTSIFLVYGGVTYGVVGSGVITSPAFKSLPGPGPAVISASLMIPATVCQASLFGSLFSRCIWDLLERRGLVPTRGECLDRDRASCWRWWQRQSLWISTHAVLWGSAVGMVIGVRNFDSLLALVASIPGSILFYMFWCAAWFLMRKADRRTRNGQRRARARSRVSDVLQAILNGFIFVLGLAGLGIGTFAGSVYETRHR